MGSEISHTGVVPIAAMLALAVIERAWDRRFQPWLGTLNRTGGLEVPRNERPTESGLRTAADPRENPPVLHPPTDPANVLEHFEIGPSQFESFVSGQPLLPAENDVLVKILYRFPRLGPEILMRWRQQGVAWDTLAAAPADYRAKAGALLWDGTKFQHHVHLEPIDHGDFDERAQLTMSNTWAITRGMASGEILNRGARASGGPNATRRAPRRRARSRSRCPSAFALSRRVR